MQENIKVTGQIHAVLTNEAGDVIEQNVQNMVMTVGKNMIASRLAGPATNPIGWMAVGTGGAFAPAVSQIALSAESARVPLTNGNGTATNATVTYTATFGPGSGTGSISECGLFNALTNGTMLARSNSVVVTKGATDTLALTWTVTIN